MYIIIWLIFGAVVGWLASILMKKNNKMGLIANILFGLIGSALGMWLLELFGYGRPDAFTLTGFLVSVGGAAILIAIVNAINRR